MTRNRLSIFAPLILILLLALPARLWRLGEEPLWHTDETNHIGMVIGLSRGTPLIEARHKALLFPFATNACPHPPLYYMLYAQAMRIGGENLWTGRALSAGFGFAAIAALWLGTRSLFGLMAAFIAAGLFAFHWPTVFFFRWSQPYNLCAALLCLSFMALAFGQRTKWKLSWNVAAAWLAGLSAAASFYGAFGLAGVALVSGWRLRRRPIYVALAWIGGAAPLIAFLILGHIARGSWFWQDMARMGGRASGGGDAGVLWPFLLQWLRIATGFRLRPAAAGGFTFDAFDFIYPLGFWGLVWIAIRADHRRWIPFLMLVIASPILLKRGGDPEIKYDEPIFLFLIHIGAGAGFAAIARFLRNILQNRLRLSGRSRRFANYTVAVLFITVIGGIRIAQVGTGLPSRYAQVGSILRAEDALELAKYINTRTEKDDLVIAPERVDYLLHCRTASPYQTVAYTIGPTTWHEGIEPGRWAYPANFYDASYIVIDHTDHAVVLYGNPNMEPLVEALQSELFQPVEQIGEYIIFRRRDGS